MEDYIIRATAGNGSIRAFAATTRNLVQEAREIHNTSPVVSAALGRMLTAVGILATTLKGEKDIITLQIRGDGPIQGIVVTADAKANVKGYPFINNVDIPPKHPGKLDVATAVGRGYLSVTKDIGLKEPYSGSVELVSGEIAEDLTYYFTTSEQTPSSIGLGVLVDTDTSIKQSGGFMIQVLPDAEEQVINILEERLTGLPSVTELLEKGKTPEMILAQIFDGIDFTITDKINTHFVCNCSRERVEKALISIGLSELEKIQREDGEATLHCHFCNKEYYFSAEALTDLTNEIQAGK